MMFVLDTNVVSELRKVRAGKADPNVAAWSESVDAAELFMSAIAIMELKLGVLPIERKDATQGALLRAWLEQHCCRSSLDEHCQSIQRWRNAAPGCTCPTSEASVTRSLQQRPLFMAWW